jgi:hypothetical protein
MRSYALTVLLLALAGPVAAAETGASASSQAACPTAAATQTKGGPAPFRRLGQLPPARLELAVLRSIGGCPVASVKVGRSVFYVPTPAPQRRALPAGEAEPAR